MYPSYRDEEATAMAEEESDEEIKRPRRPRSRYIDGEVEDFLASFKKMKFIF